jgi:hypothetical protein
MRSGLSEEYFRQCRDATLTALEVVLSRFEDNLDYPFIDTKFSILTGKDFPELEDPEMDFRGRSAVFGCIQGRGLEALAGHAEFLSRETGIVKRIDRMIETVGNQIVSTGKANQGRFCFLFTPDGRPFRLSSDGRKEYFEAASIPPGYTDLFMGKGLVAAGIRLKKSEWVEMGMQVFRSAARAIVENKFRSDQISFDVRNPVQWLPQKRAQGPRMIALGGFAILARHFPDGNWIAEGCAFVEHLLNKHVVMTAGQFRKFDFLENVDEQGGPWQDNGKVLQDPGHALEFTGLAAKFLLSIKEPSVEARVLIEKCREILPEVFLQAFENGFQPRVGGICKTFDLVARVPANDDMPWWSLPETMRAAVLLAELAPNYSKRSQLLRAAEDCAQALFQKYGSVVSGFFIQTRNSKGEAADVVPATPDADPGYHTGLCLIDFLSLQK